MPSDSTGRFLTAPIRAVRSFKRHSHSTSCQEPIRRPPGPLEALEAPGPSGPLGPLGPLVQLVQSVQSVQLEQLGQLK